MLMACDISRSSTKSWLLVAYDRNAPRGINGSILIVATAEEKQAFRDMVLLGMSQDNAAQVIARRIQERTRGFVERT